MNYILVFKTHDGPEVELDLETSDQARAIDTADQFIRGGEGIVEYAQIFGTTSHEFSYSTCEWELA